MNHNLSPSTLKTKLRCVMSSRSSARQAACHRQPALRTCNQSHGLQILLPQVSIASPASDTELSCRNFFHESFFAQINSNNLSFLRFFFFGQVQCMEQLLAPILMGLKRLYSYGRELWLSKVHANIRRYVNIYCFILIVFDLARTHVLFLASPLLAFCSNTYSP